MTHHTHRSSHLYEYTIRYGGGEQPSVEGRRLIRQETDARNWEFPQVRTCARVMR